MRPVAVTEQTSLTDRDFRSFFLKSPIERMIVSVEPDGRFVYAEVNAAAAAYFEMAREDMIGRAPSEIFEKSVAEHIEHSFVACVRTRNSAAWNALPRIPGGVRMHVFVLNPVLDAAGHVRFIDIAARPDTTDAMQLQRERDDAIILMTSLFDASGSGILVTDRHGRIVRVNDAFLSEYGWSREDLLGEEFTVLIPEKDRAISRRLHHAFIDHGHHGTRELQILRKNGGLADILATNALLELTQKRRFMVSTIRDMTERKNMMRNLKRAKDEADGASKAKSSFLANMSHELRTPLNAIIGFSELMKNRTFGPIGNPRYEEYMGDIHFSARHLLDIINDVLDMSKIEAGKVELVESEISAPDLFDSIQRIMADRAQAAGVRLAFNAAPGTPHIKADQRLLRQVLINLVSNAVKFSKDGGAVTTSIALRPDNGLRITIEDQGCGIPAAKLAHVMLPFGQVNDPPYYAAQGTGLGLPLAKAMTELHNGALTLESEEGKGTKATVDFPPERTLPAA